MTVIFAILRLWGPIVWPPYDPLTLLPYPILAVASSLLLVSLVSPNQTFFGSVLSGVTLRFIGKLSFSLYLVHVLIITILRDTIGMTFGGLWFNVAFAMLCLPIAGIFYYCVERPFLKIKAHLGPVLIPWPAIIIWTAIAIGLVRFFINT